MNIENPRLGIKPMMDRVLIKRIVEETVSAGGIVLPDSAQEKDLIYGTVIAKGLPRKDYIGSSEIELGNKVAFVKYAAANITDGIDNYLIIRYDDILAVIK